MMQGYSGSFELTRLRRVVNGVEVETVERVQEASCVGPQLRRRPPCSPAVDVEGSQRHRAVDVDRDSRYLSQIGESLQLEQHQLGPVHRERRHQDRAAAGHGPAYGAGQHVGVRHRMTSIAIGGLDHQRADRRRWGWGPQKRMALTAEVATERHSVPVTLQHGDGRAEDVSGRYQRRVHAIGQRDTVAELDGIEQAQGGLDVAAVVERQGRPVLGPASLVRPSGVLLLQVGAVAQHDRGQVGGVPRADDAAAESFADKSWQVPAVVEVGMGEHHRVQAGGRNGERRPVPASQRGDTLVEAGVDQHAAGAALDEEAAPGDGARGTEERQCRAGAGAVLFHVAVHVAIPHASHIGPCVTSSVSPPTASTAEP